MGELLEGENDFPLRSSVRQHRGSVSLPDEHEVFAEWNKGDLDSYLIEITRDILAKKDEDGEPLVDKILDTAGQKGTGKWTSVNALDMGVPAPTIAESVFARCISRVSVGSSPSACWPSTS